MAATLQSCFTSIPNHNPTGNLYGVTPLRPLLRFRAATLYSASRQLDSTRLCLRIRPHSERRRIPRLVPLAGLHEESKHSEIEVGKEKNEAEINANESEEAWKRTLDSFKEEAVKMKNISLEAYAIYSEKAIVILNETSKKLKIQADKARYDLSILAKEMAEEGKEYISSSSPPESVKVIVETFSSAPDELKDLSCVQDFHIGIPYGSFLALGGFLSFMLTGSIPAIRFGVILGTALFYLSLQSLRSSKIGQSSAAYLNGQTAIAAIIFLRELRMFFEIQLFTSLMMTLISGAVLALYAYRSVTNNSGKGPSLEPGSEN